jgi:hypothetical protein
MRSADAWHYLIHDDHACTRYSACRELTKDGTAPGRGPVVHDVAQKIDGNRSVLDWLGFKEAVR